MGEKFLRDDEIVIEKIPNLYDDGGRVLYQVKYYTSEGLKLVDFEIEKDAEKYAKKIKKNYGKKRIRRTY